eukprot:1037502-Pelagomonas_calceolata.AAC.1
MFYQGLSISHTSQHLSQINNKQGIHGFYGRSPLGWIVTGGLKCEAEPVLVLVQAAGGPEFEPLWRWGSALP